MKNRYRNYLLLFISVLIIGTGITLITNAGLGATAVTSLAFVISELWEISFGKMTAIFNIIWVLFQLFILRRNFPKIQFLQFFVAILLGYSVDLSNALFGWIKPTTYITHLLLLLIGCLILSFGVAVQLKAKLIYNPAEGIVAAISKMTKKSFGTIKTAFDLTLVGLSVILGLIVVQQVIGIREGTVISALIIGPFTGIFQKIINRE